MYDKTKVDFTDLEHEAAENADKIYEEVKEALADGADLGDIAVLPALYRPTVELYKYLFDSVDRDEVGRKLLTLGNMVLRENA
jgi:hypothetical protein